MKANRATLAGAVSVLVAALAGCSVSGSARVGIWVEPDNLGKSVAAVLAEQVGRELEDVSCPDPLEGEVGETVRCTATDQGATYGATVTVTRVEGTTIDFDVDVDPEPLTSPSS